MDVIDQIRHEIERLNDQILKREAFNEEDGVNLNALVCMLRYAAWKEPNRLYDYFMRKECHWKQATINPKIVKRFSLHEPEGDDGAQLRIHIFDDAEETSKHNHQRSFITMCIQGGYEYRYYKFVEEGDSEIEIWNRVNGEFELSKTKKEPFDKSVTARRIFKALSFLQEKIDHTFLIQTQNHSTLIIHGFTPFIQRISMKQ